ncbi:hypothetical protein [Extensimonas vulgaris]|uniref:hypothetical protein n=2 Tax=Extensimonas vulgaris TaxID=1031594 RepID=UPI0011A970E1|nr:hypothetical protein [Extensimonas vulgaris]TXD15004.1 hypothetical protein FUT63_08555 [Extensimonas vulgaris]
MASMTHSTIQNAMKKVCLDVPEGANQCHSNNEKSPQNRGLRVVLVPAGASHCQTRDHSHSVINESRKSAWLKGFAMIEMGPYRRLYRLHRTSFAGAGDGAISGVTTLAAPSSIAF